VAQLSGKAAVVTGGASGIGRAVAARIVAEGGRVALWDKDEGRTREAAQASLDWAWANIDAAEIVAITVQDNAASWGLMERLGMVRDVGGEFDHPLVPEGDPLRRHILYRIARPA